MRRTGIDLSPARCTVVDASVTSRWRKHGERSLLRVHNFATLEKPDSPQALTAELKLLADGGAFSRHAWVTLWDIRSSHQYMKVAPARVKDAESIAAHHGASVLGLLPRDISVGVAEGTPPADPREKAELSFFAAASEDIHARLRAVQAAGFIVDGVCTPCGALWAQARLRRALPGAVHAYVALGASSSALAIVSNGFLLYAREMRWGFIAPSTNPPAAETSAALSERLASELKRSFLYLKQFWEEDVSQVLLCGDMPDIRSLTAPLIERLDIEVETLDSLDGIDTVALPGRAEELTSHVAALRLATAIAAEPPPVNLWREDPRVERGGGRGRAILAACVVAAAVLGGLLYPRQRVLEQPAPPVVVPLQPQVTAPNVSEQTVKAEPVGSVTADVERVVEERPVSVPPAASDRAERTAASAARPRKGGMPTVRPLAIEGPDPVVHAILFSSQQRSALVDNRVVRPGDLVGSDTVQSIEADAVVLVNEAGQVRRLVLERPVSQVTKK